MEDGMALPEDVLIEILVNLPIKSLLRFRCVSKYWCGLIKSPNFVSRHLNHDRKESVLLKHVLPRPSQGSERRGGREVLSFHDPNFFDVLVSPNLPIPPFLDHLVGDVFFQYMGACNGLVCLTLKKIIVLCNPALKEFELLPPSPFDVPEGHFDCNVAMGFGFDAITNSYKVLQLWTIADKAKDYPQVYEDAWMRVDLYNSSTNSWRLIDAVIPKLFDVSTFNLFFSGACHWRSATFDILSFDLNTEVFRRFEYPHFEDEKFEHLAVLHQCLSLVRVGGWGDARLNVDPQLWANDPDLVEIWVMKEYGVKESWTKEFVIGPYAFNYPILLLNNDWLLVITYEYQLASCALHGKEIKRFDFYDKNDVMLAVIYRESLISLKQVIFHRKED